MAFAACLRTSSAHAQELPAAPEPGAAQPENPEAAETPTPEAAPSELPATTEAPPVSPPVSPPPAAAFPDPAPTSSPTALPAQNAPVPSAAAPAVIEGDGVTWQPTSPHPDAGVEVHREKRDDSHGVLGPFRIGVLAGVGLPNLLNFGATLKLTRYFGAGVNVGLIPTVRIAFYGDATVSYQEYDVYGRIYPFGGGFFLGAGVGYAKARGTHVTSTDISEYAEQFPSLDLPDALSTDSKGSVQAMVLTPQLGYFRIFGSGFCVGIDVGAQIPIARSEVELETRTSEEVPAAVIERYVVPNQREVRDTLESVARTPIPTFNLRIGWVL